MLPLVFAVQAEEPESASDTSSLTMVVHHRQRFARGVTEAADRLQGRFNTIDGRSTKSVTVIVT